MSVGLDVGAGSVRSLRLEQGPALVGRRCRSRFAVLPSEPEHVRLLERGRVPFVRCGDALVLLGDAAAEYARLFQVRPESALPDGRLPTDDPLRRQVLTVLLESVLPRPTSDGQTCCLTLPLANEPAAEETVRFVQRVVRLAGFRPLVASQGLAAVLAELAEWGFTGVGLVAGASSLELVVAHQARPVVGLGLPKGGDWLERQVQELFPDDAGEAAGLVGGLAQYTGVLGDPRSELDALLTERVEQLLDEALSGLRERLERPEVAPFVTRPLPVACVGGLTALRGFRPLLKRVVRRLQLPIDADQVRCCPAVDYAVARGCLIRAELEAERLSRSAA